MSSSDATPKRNFLRRGSGKGGGVVPGLEQGSPAGRVRRRNSATFKTNVNHPFSREDLPASSKPKTRMGETSADAPWSEGQPTTTDSRPSSARKAVPKGNRASTDNPLTGAPVTEDRPSTRSLSRRYSSASLTRASRDSLAGVLRASDNGQAADNVRKPRAYNPNAPSAGNPLSRSSSHASLSQSRSSLRLTRNSASRQNLQLFEGPVKVEHKPKATPTFVSAVDSPFSKQEPPPKPARTQPKANEMSAAHPFSGKNYVPPPEKKRAPPKANIPDRASPFSTAPQPMRRGRSSNKFTTSADSPFASAASRPIGGTLPRSRSGRRISMGSGSQTFSVFHHDG